MKKDNIYMLRFDYNKLYKKYVKAVDAEDVYGCCQMFNRLKEMKDEPQLYLYQASLYAKLGSIACEINSLLKIISYPKFNTYNPRTLLYRINMFFQIYNGMDRYDNYLRLLEDRFKDMPELLDFEKPQLGSLGKKIHLVELSGKYLYSQAIEQLREGDDEKSKELLEKVPEDDNYYVKAQNLMSLIHITKGDAEKSKESINNAIEKDSANMESYANMYRTMVLQNIDPTPVLEKVRALEIDPEDFDSIMSKVILLMDEEYYIDAIKELEKISTINRFSEMVLQKMAECYEKVGDYEKLKSVLKQYIVIYPKEPLVRLALSHLESGEPIRLKDFLRINLKKEFLGDVKKEIRAVIKNADSFQKLSREDKLYYFYISHYTKDYLLIKKVAKVMLKSDCCVDVYDSLFYIDTPHVVRQLLLQAILEMGLKRPFYCLVDGDMIMVDVEYPQIFNPNIAVEPKKLEFLRTGFAQSYSLLLFTGEDTTEFKKYADAIIGYLTVKDLDDEFEILREVDNVVYMLTYTYSQNRELINSSFYNLSTKTKERVLGLYQKILDEILVNQNELDKEKK